MLTRLGGRKFLMALITIGVGTAIEMYTTRGITPAFAGLLATDRDWETFSNSSIQL